MAETVHLTATAYVVNKEMRLSEGDRILVSDGEIIGVLRSKVTATGSAEPTKAETKRYARTKKRITPKSLGLLKEDQHEVYQYIRTHPLIDYEALAIMLNLKPEAKKERSRLSAVLRFLRRHKLIEFLGMPGSRTGRYRSILQDSKSS